MTDRDKLIQETLQYISPGGGGETYVGLANVPTAMQDLTMRILNRRSFLWTDPSLPDGKSVVKLVTETVKRAAERV